MKNNFKGVLLDLDGVVYEDNILIDGAHETIEILKKRNMPFRFITNTTIKTRNEIALKLSSLGIETNPQSIFSAIYSANKFVETQNYKNVLLLVPKNVMETFSVKYEPGNKVDAVIVADIGADFNFEILNKAFSYLLEGADLIAAHKNRYWKNERKFQVDAGGFITLLEYAAGVKAKIIGKPAKPFFNMALKDMELSAGEVLMVGDDVTTDIDGAKHCGIKSALVKTGKFRESDLKEHNPDFVISSIKELPEILFT